MRKAVILQPNYIPWKGNFDMIHQADVFVFLEDVQYTKADWRNRNKILTDKGEKWLSVPVYTKGKYYQLICEAEINNETDWQRQHFLLFKQYYHRAKYFYEYKWILDELYNARQWKNISDLDIFGIKMIAKALNISAEFVSSLELGCGGTKDDKLIAICKAVGADVYLSGAAAKAYIMPEKFDRANIKLEYVPYDYPEYKQLFEPFDHYVTVLDLLFNCGSEAAHYIWGWREFAK